MKKFAENGASIVIITDKIDDVYKYADTVTIIRDGEILLSDSIQNVDKMSLIRIAYTQIQKENVLADSNREFYNLLKYNQAILENLPLNLISL